MSIGKMRYRIKVEVMTIVSQPGGGSNEEWGADTDVSPDGMTWADVKPLSSKRTVVSDKVIISNGYKIILRWATGRIMDKKRRIIYNDKIFSINGVSVIDEAKRFYEIICIGEGQKATPSTPNIIKLNLTEDGSQEVPGGKTIYKIEVTPEQDTYFKIEDNDNNVLLPVVFIPSNYTEVINITIIAADVSGIYFSEIVSRTTITIYLKDTV